MAVMAVMTTFMTDWPVFYGLALSASRD
jgi:hypothetical protein